MNFQPRLQPPLEPRLAAFTEALRLAKFEGDTETGLGARTVASTDNSIYQVMPEAIVYPRTLDDINCIVRASLAEGSAGLSLTARGGDTGTNGQSLNGGVVVDFARYLTRIIDVDVEGLTVVVEPGVVLAQLNAELARFGLFFPPTVSTASRATIGGMVATDASGKGSRVYGKTSDYVEAMDVVLADGSDWHCEPMSRDAAERLGRGTGLVARIHREVLAVVDRHADTIAAVFPEMNRGLTGYNLKKVYDAAIDRFSLTYLLAGSEGTLALTKAVRLKVCRKPAARALAIVRYDDADAALSDVERLLDADPLAVEFLDDKVLAAVSTDVVWSSLNTLLGGSGGRETKALNFVEFVGAADSDLRPGLSRLEGLSERAPEGQIDVRTVDDEPTIAKLWSLREQAVGLLARVGGGRPGIPFIEDTAVPPQHLPHYVSDLRQLLDHHHLQYGMFGHADVGCLHIRPFIDLRDPAEEPLIRQLSDDVAALTKRYGGLLWGEHGRGYRGEYSPLFFGPELYPELIRIKTAFDPHNRFNPGKLAAPTGAAGIVRIDAVPLRGQRDRMIRPELAGEFRPAIACNGNGVCFSWDATEAMCPSFKVTRDRAQSPKGRSALLREWARLDSLPGAPSAERERAEIEAATMASLSTCLSCKACTTACPVNVDIPSLRSRFLSRYYATRRRPLRHLALRHAEAMFALGRRFPDVANAILGVPGVRLALRTLTGLVDLPAFSPPSRRWKQVPLADPRRFRALTPAERRKTVAVVEDSFTSSFDAGVLDATRVLLERLGYVLYRIPARPNGKILHLLGMRRLFADVAARRIQECSSIAAAQVRLVAIDAVTALMFEQEYREAVPSAAVSVVGVETLLSQDIADGRFTTPEAAADPPSYRLLGHCTEKALRPRVLDDWSALLGLFGIVAEPANTGCCGMAGMFGHEAAHLSMSKSLFELSWRRQIEGGDGRILVTGYSCREQVRRFSGFRPRHPVELLAEMVTEG